MLLAHFVTYFSYQQIIVSDAMERAGLDWTDAHTSQGFARRESNASFKTILESGLGEVQVFSARPECWDAYERVIGVPFRACSGRITVDGPDAPGDEVRLTVPVGDYRLYCAQRVTVDDDLHGEECIDLFLEQLERPAERSEILVRDAALVPPSVLLENAKVAGE